MSTGRFQLLVPRLPPARDFAAYLDEIDQASVYSNFGPLNTRLCAEIARFVEGRATRPAKVHATTTSNGTISIELALRATKLPDRKHILLPSYTFIATGHAVQNVGCEPVFLDIDPDSMTLSMSAVRDWIAANGLPAAIIVVSPFGAPGNIRPWEQLQAETGVPVVFDFAAALTNLAEVGAQPVCISLHATKMVGVGEGGAVLSTDAALVERIQRMTSFGFDTGTRVSAIRGGNYRISEFAAAIGLAALADAERKISVLKSRAKAYRDALSGNDARVQDGFGIDWVAMTMNLVLPDERVDAILAALDAKQIPWRRWYGDGCHLHPVFAGDNPADLPETRRVSRRIVGVPFHERLSDDDIAEICKCIRAA